MIEQGVRRGAILAWRDDATLSAMLYIDSAISKTVRAFGSRVESVALIDAMIKGGETAREIVQLAMQERVSASIGEWLAAHAMALREIDDRLEIVASRFGAFTLPPLWPQKQVRTDFSLVRTRLDRLGAPVGKVTSAISQAKATISSRIISDDFRKGIIRLSTQAVRAFGKQSGLYNRLSKAAQQELHHSWLAPVAEGSEARAHICLLFEHIDETARAARETIA